MMSRLSRLSVSTVCLVGLVAAAAHCSSKTPAATTGAPRIQGDVPADLRDVERTGEGAVNTTLAAQWDRAASVSGILKRVWAAYKPVGAKDGAPAANVKQIDDAIVALDAAIAVKDMEKAANAANQVGLACPELFDRYQTDPGTPTLAVLRLDAMFRQVGIDSKFGHWDLAAADLKSIKDNWATTKDPVAARAPTCSKVGGTATVSGDIDQSVANLTTSVAAKDAAGTQKESDNGATEIDTLEQLFDCPHGSAPPANGPGAACKVTSDCAAGQACDTRFNPPRCAPDGSHAKIGTKCATTIDCGDDARSACLQEASDGYPGGYCGMEPCNDINTCPTNASCVALGGETPGCYLSCQTDADCRASEGYICQLFSVTAFGPTNRACAFKCRSTADCDKGLTCPDPAPSGTGICKP